MTGQTMRIRWTDGGVPISEAFDDPYFSASGGAGESAHVFLGGNDLPARFADGFHIAELGFGSGLNMLVAWDAWLRSGATGHLNFTSFEAFPMQPADMRRALAGFPELDLLSGQFLSHWQGPDKHIVLEGLNLIVIGGDARRTVAAWGDRADAWFLDGFSPAKNPELWGGDLMREIARHTAPGGTAATYSAAGLVRANLGNAGFAIERLRGYAAKRHMTRARLLGAK